MTRLIKPYQPPDLYRPTLPETFGTARWATLYELQQRRWTELAKGKHMGPLLGALTPEEIGGRDLHHIYANGDQHIASFGTTGSGKNRGQILTNLLWYPGSVLVLDFKGENFDRTAGWRSANGHRIIRYAPFKSGSAKWNLFDSINRGCGQAPNHPRRQEVARFFANLMVPVNEQAKEPYFDKAAKSLLHGLLLFVATAPTDGPIRINDTTSIRVTERTMAEVCRLLNQETYRFIDTLKAMAVSSESLVRQTAGIMHHMLAAKQQSAGVITVLAEHLNVWAFQRVQEVSSTTTMHFGQQLRDEQPTTIYLEVPFEELTDSGYRSLLRPMIGACMRELRESWSEERDNARPPVLMMLDEFPQLQFMEPIEQALLYMRSYAVRFWFFFQGIGDVQRHYPNSWRSFMSNCSKCFYGVDDIDTAKLVSEMSGAMTVTNRSYQATVNENDTVSDSSTTGDSKQKGSSFSMDGFWGWGWNNSEGTSSSRTFTSSRTTGSSYGTTLGYVGRPLIMPDEVLRRPFGSMISLTRGMPPILGQLRFWDQDVEGFRKRGMIPPPPIGGFE